MRWRGRAIVAFDTETTGLEPFGGDRVIEFAAVKLVLGDDGQVAAREDHAFLIDPQMPIPRKVTEITGITDAQVTGRPTFGELATQIRDLLADAITVAHNYPFDLAFLTQEFLRAGRRWPEPLAEIDTVDLSMRCFPDVKGHRLQDLTSRLDINLVGAHRATNDAAACGLAFAALARRHDVADDLAELLEWAHAIGRPPEDGPIGPEGDGRIVFRDGPKRGEPVVEHPLVLAWMEKARVRGPDGWGFRYPESTRRWIRRWLEVRGAGRARTNAKSFHAQDWVIDPCIALPRGVGAFDAGRAPT